MMPLDMAVYLDENIPWLIRPSTAAIGETANLYALDMPDMPDSCVSVLQYGGEAPLQTYGNTSVIKKPRMQITVRNKRSDIAFQQAEEIYDLLKEIKGQTINNIFYHRVSPVSEPSELGPDSGGRERVVCNFSVWMKGYTENASY